MRLGFSVEPHLLQPYCNPSAERFVEPFHGVAAYAVTVVTLLISIGLLRDAAYAPPRDCHVIVIVNVTEETPYLSGSLAGVTVMTLVTVICGCFLDKGATLQRAEGTPLRVCSSCISHLTWGGVLSNAPDVPHR